MAGEEQYYNPIIQAMIHSATLQQGAQQQGIEKAKLKTQQEQAKNELAAHLKQIDYEHEHQLGLTNIAQKQHETAAELARINAILEMNKASGQGVNVGAALSAPGAGGGPNILQGMKPEDFTNPTAEAARIKNQAIAQSSGAAEGAFPTQKNLLDLETQNKKFLQDSENKFKATETDKTLASHEKIAKLDNDTHRFISDATNAVHLKVAGMQYSPSPSTLQAMTIGGMTGKVKLDGSNPFERAAMSSIMEMGGKTLDPKEVDVLRQSQQLAPLFDKLQSFAQKLPESKSGAFVQGHALGTAKSLGYSSDTQNEINMLKSQALNIGKALEGMTGGRVLMSQMQLDLDSFASSSITKSQMVDRINNLKDYYINKVDNMYLQGVPTAQRMLLYKQEGILPGYLSMAPKKNKAGHSIDIEESIKNGQPVYSN